MKRLVLAAGAVAIFAAGCGSTTIRVVTSVKTVTVASAPKVVPLKFPAVTDGQGTYITWTGPGAGVVAAEFQRNSAKLGTFWTMTEQAGNNTQSLVCKLSLGGLRAYITLTFNSGDDTTASNVCADFIKIGFHQDQ